MPDSEHTNEHDRADNDDHGGNDGEDEIHVGKEVHQGVDKLVRPVRLTTIPGDFSRRGDRTYKT